jgi:hypothetical protein
VLLKLMSIKSRHKKNSILELKIFSKLWIKSNNKIL